MILGTILLTLLGTWGSEAASGNWISLDGETDFQSPAEITVVEANSDYATVRLDLPGYAVQILSGYIRYDLPQVGWNTAVPVGDPELPMVSAVVGLPMGMTPEVTLIDSRWEDAGTGTAYPVQPMRYDDDIEPFVFADLSSDLTGTYPASTVDLYEQGVWSGANTVVLQFNPFRWNADTGQFTVASSITARVDFTGNRGYQCTVRPEIALMHSSSIVNYNSLDIPVDASPVSMDDVVYICLVPPENLETITPYLAMVNSLGHHVNIIELETGTTSYLIKSAINSVYQAGVTRFALIAAKHQQLEAKAYSGFVGDYYYECLDSDNLPDIAVGRFPGDATQIPNQTAKAMSYTSYAGEPGEPSISASVILCAHEENYPDKYTANSNAVRDWTYSLATPVFETCYPPEGGTYEQVQDAINEGVGIVNYRGHGSTTTWQWSPGWNAGKIYALTNTFFPPAFNIACSNGTHDLSYNCLSESWLDAEDKGSSGNIGASASSFTAANDLMQTEIFKILFDEGITCAGEMFASSQTAIIQAMPSAGLSNSRMYHWFGDPAMDIPNSDLPGTPFELTIDAPASVNSGANSLNLTVTSHGSPVQGAVVTVTDGIGNHSTYTESFYEQAITTSSGEVTLDFTALDGKDLYYGVRLHNYASVTGTIEVFSQGISGDTQDYVSLSEITPSPATVNAAFTFSAPEGTPVNISVVDLTGRIVSTVHDQSATGSVNQISLNTSEMSPGIYFVIMQTSGNTLTRRMTVVR